MWPRSTKPRLIVSFSLSGGLALCERDGILTIHVDVIWMAYGWLASLCQVRSAAWRPPGNGPARFSDPFESLMGKPIAPGTTRALMEDYLRVAASALGPHGFTHLPLAFDDLTAASTKARPLTPSSMVGK